MSEADKRVLPVANLREFFKDSLHGALTKQRVSVEDQMAHGGIMRERFASRADGICSQHAYKRGGWEVDIVLKLPSGEQWRERVRSPADSRAASMDLSW